MKIYISFGLSHFHIIGGKTFDKDTIAEIECDSYLDGRKKAFEYFGDRFFTSYTEKEIKDALYYFHKGILKVENNI